MINQLFAAYGQQAGTIEQNTSGGPIPLIFMIMGLFLIMFFFLIRPRRRRKKGKGSALGRLKLVSVFIFIIAGMSIIGGLSTLFLQKELTGIISCIIGALLILLGLFVRKKYKFALWCLEGLSILSIIVPFVIKYLKWGAPQMKEAGASSIIASSLGFILGMGIVIGILNEGFIAIRDLKQEEEKEEE